VGVEEDTDQRVEFYSRAAADYHLVLDPLWRMRTSHYPVQAQVPNQEVRLAKAERDSVARPLCRQAREANLSGGASVKALKR